MKSNVFGLVLSLGLALAGCAGKAPPAAVSEPEPGGTAEELHAAARSGDLARVRELVEERGVPVDAGDRYGATALMGAAEYGQVEVLEYLIGRGGDVNVREQFFGMSPLMQALRNRRDQAAILLVRSGSDQLEFAIDFALNAGVPGLAEAALAAGPIRESTIERLLSLKGLSKSAREAAEAAQRMPDPAPPGYSAAELRRFEGTFETFDAGGGETRARGEAAQGGLALTIGDEPPVRLTASDEDEFRSADGRIEAAFWGRLGTIESLTLVRDGRRGLPMRHSIAEPLGAAAFKEIVEKEAGSGPHWPQFRGRQARGVADGAEIRAEWNLESGDGILWQVELPGLGNSSPIVWGDTVIVTTAVAEGLEQEVRTGLTGAGDPVDESVEHRWLVMAFDKRSGEKRWETEVGRGVPLTRRHFKASQASSTPATDGRYVVAVFPTAGIGCLDMDGRLLWKHDLGGLNASSPSDPGIEWGFSSSPVIHGDRAIAQIDVYGAGYVAAWSLADGRQLWKTRREQPPTWATPTVLPGPDGDELILNGATIQAYDPQSGEELWSVGPNSEIIIATPVPGDGVVYVSAGYAPVKPIYAIRLGTRGTLDVAPGEPHAQLAWSHNRGGAYMPTPLHYRGLLYVVHHNGRMVAYDARSGDAIYKTRFSKGGTFTASPVAAAGKLYIGTEEGTLYVVAAGPQYRELAVNELPEPLMATPAISDGTLYVRTTRRLVAIGG